VIRKTEKINLDAIYELRQQLKNASIEILLDLENEKEANNIRKFILGSGKNKFKRIVYEILNHRYNDSLYKKVKGYDNVTEMLFKSKYLNNSRIYCKEERLSNKTIVMLYLREKDQKAIKDDVRLLNIVEKISKITYKDTSNEGK
jgi:hypothetical protein